MPSEYFLQCVTGNWEEVDDYIFDNWKYALEDNKPRYTGNRVSVIDHKSKFYLETDISAKDLIHMAKLSGEVNHHVLTAALPGGFVKKPEYVMLKVRNRNIIRKVGDRSFVAKEKNEEAS